MVIMKATKRFIFQMTNFTPGLELSSKPERFEGYTITMTGFVYHDSKFMSDNEFIPARLVMSCCVADVVPGGIICKYDKSDQLQNDAWITVTGKIYKRRI